MNILWLSHLVPYPPKGGVLQRSFNLIKEVSKSHNLHLLAFSQKNLLKNENDLNQAVGELEKICRSVKVVPIPSEEKSYGKAALYVKSLFTAAPYTINWLRSGEMEHQIEEILTKRKIDMVHFDTISLAPYYSLAEGYKKILNHHNIESDMMIRRGGQEKNPIKKVYLLQEGYKILRYENRVCESFDLNLTCSLLDSERLLRRIPRLRVEEIPNGVDLKYFYPLNQIREEHSLVFAGGMKWYPNRSAMLFFVNNIWPLLKKEVPDVKMTVIGREPPPEVVNLARMDGHFKVTGFVDDVRPYIDKAMVYVCPIRDGGGTRLKILDALAMGKPIVAHPVAVEGIDVEPEKQVLIAETPSEFVRQIARLFGDSILYRRLSEEGRRLVMEKYDFEKIGEKLSRVYREMSEDRVPS